jgi:hypothetical protein
MYIMKKNEILKDYKDRVRTLEETLYNLSRLGSCPNLLYDDNGHWALVFDGFQTLCTEDKPIDIETTFWVKAEDWKDNIYDAVIWSLKEE